LEKQKEQSTLEAGRGKLLSLQVYYQKDNTLSEDDLMQLLAPIWYADEVLATQR
jgi:hypothetical protein